MERTAVSFRDTCIDEIRRAPDDIVAKTLDFVRFLTTTARAKAPAMASEPILRRDWDDPEEDEAWQSL